MFHFVKKCRRCLIVLNQCRCMQPDKLITYGLCEKCAVENEQAHTADAGQPCHVCGVDPGQKHLDFCSVGNKPHV